jgi:hypothetical protein
VYSDRLADGDGVSLAGIVTWLPIHAPGRIFEGVTRGCYGLGSIAPGRGLLPVVCFGLLLSVYLLGLLCLFGLDRGGGGGSYPPFSHFPLFQLGSSD